MHQCDDVCKADFARKDNLTRHQNTVRCKSKDVILKHKLAHLKASKHITSRVNLHVSLVKKKDE